MSFDSGWAALIGALIGGGFSLLGTLISARVARQNEERRELRASVAEFLDLLARYGTRRVRDSEWLNARTNVLIAAQRMMLHAPRGSSEVQVVVGRTLESLDSDGPSRTRVAAVNALAHVVAEWHAGRLDPKGIRDEFVRTLTAQVGPNDE